MWPALAAAIPTLFLSLPVVRSLAAIAEAILPKDETSAVFTDSFIGHVATITLGDARKDMPAEARLTDQHGTTHYIYVIPERDAAPITQGTPVLLVRKEGTHFVAIEDKDNLLKQ